MLIGRFLHVALWQQTQSALRPAVVTAIFFTLAANPTLVLPQWQRFTADGWVGLIVNAALSFLLIVICAFYSGLTGPQRGQILSRLQRMIALPG